MQASLGLKERGLDSGKADSCQLGRREAEMRDGQSIFVDERGMEHQRIVRVDRQADARVPELGQRMGRKTRHGACSEIARRADLEDDPALTKIANQLAVLGRTEAMADAWWIESERIPDALGPDRLASMWDEGHPLGLCPTNRICIQRGRPVRLVAGEPQGDHPAVLSLHAPFGRLVAVGERKSANVIEDETHLHAQLTSCDRRPGGYGIDHVVERNALEPVVRAGCEGYFEIASALLGASRPSSSVTRAKSSGLPRACVQAS
jgi:hypothetical protein